MTSSIEEAIYLHMGNVLLIFEKIFWLKRLQKLPRFVGHIYTVFAFTMGWVLFYFTDLGQLGSFMGRLFVPAATDISKCNLILGFLPLTAVAIFASTPAMRRLWDKNTEKPVMRYGCIAAAAVAMVLCVAALASQSYNPFIYFRF